MVASTVAPIQSYRGLNNHRYYFVGVPYYEYSIMGHQNPILMFKATL